MRTHGILPVIDGIHYDTHRTRPLQRRLGVRNKYFIRSPMCCARRTVSSTNPNARTELQDVHRSRRQRYRRRLRRGGDRIQQTGLPTRGGRGRSRGGRIRGWEFFRLTDDPSRTGYEVLIEETDPRYVHFEMDLFWVTRGARDPVDLLRRLNGRVRQYHVKDMNQAGSFEDPGQGLIDFARVFRARQVDEYIVERDDAGSPPRAPEAALDTARVGYDFLRTIRF